MLQEKFDKILKQKLESYTANPPDDLWNKLEQQLPPTTPWYDKYKYLFLLLLLVSTSVGSVLVYENWIKPTPKSFNAIANEDNALNINETNNSSNNSTSNNSNNINLNTNKNTSASNSTSKTSTTTKHSTSSSTTLSVVNNQQKNSLQQHQNNINNYKKITSKNTSATNNKQVNVTSNLSTTKQKNKQNKITSNSTTSVITNTTTANAIYDDEQFTNSLERRKENAANTEMLASIDVSKIDLPKLSSETLLASLVSEKASINTNKTVAGIDDIDEEKEAMLQNLNEFAGYDINKGFHFGALLSLHTNFMNNKVFNNEQVNNYNSKIDFGKAFGINIGYDFSSRYGFQTEIQYNEAGKTIVDNSNGEAIKREVSFNNIKIPLLFKYKISYINNYNSKPIVLNFLAGPQASFLIGKQYEVNGKANNFNSINYSTTNIGFAGGIDVDLYMKRNFYFTIGARTSADFATKKGAPNNYQIGFTTQFNFRMPKKIK